MVERVLILLVFLDLLFICASKPVVSEAFKDNEIASLPNPIIERIERDILQIISNEKLTWRQRNKKIDQVYASVPPELLAQLPLSPVFNRLPKEIYHKVNAIHTNKNMKLRERRNQIRQVLDHVYWEQRIAMLKQDLPPEPPPGFEKVLDADTYNRLLEILQDPQISVDEKKHEINKIMSALPAEIISQLPIPDSFKKMPMDIQRNLRKLLYNFDLEWDERFKQLRQYIRTLPKTYRRILRAGSLPNKVDELAKTSGTSKKEFNFPIKMEPVAEQTTSRVAV